MAGKTHVQKNNLPADSVKQIDAGYRVQEHEPADPAESLDLHGSSPGGIHINRFYSVNFNPVTRMLHRCKLIFIINIKYFFKHKIGEIAYVRNHASDGG